MTDARLHSDRPIDDELPFEPAEDVKRDGDSKDEDALVTPAASTRDRITPDRPAEPTDEEPRP